MRIVITGGAGYVGSELVKRLANAMPEAELVIYDNLSRKNFNIFIDDIKFSGNVKFIHGDILDSRKLGQIIQGTDVVVHLAAKVSTPYSNNEESHPFEQVNHWGTAELSYAIENSNVQKVIYTSSLSVYGESAEKINDKSLTQPQTFYGVTKLNGEAFIQRLEKHSPFILRCGNIYGYSPSMRFDAVINRFMFDANFKKKVSIKGNGLQKRAFIHVRKVTEVLLAMIKGEVRPDIYNLADLNLSVFELAGTVKEIYPEVEFAFIDQHMKLRSVEISDELEIKNQLALEPADLLSELRQFASNFSF